MIIESSQNKIVKEVIALKSKKDRDRLGLFVIEGERFIDEIPSDWIVEYVVVSEDYKGDFSRFKNVFVVRKNLFDKMSDTVNPQGVLAVLKIKKNTLDSIDKNGFYVVLDRVMDPGNMGTIIRTADAGGADGVILSKGCVDLYNNKVLRSTMGSLFHLPVYQNVELTEAMDKLKNAGITTIAAHLEGDKFPYSLDLKKGCAILIGNEANGLCDEVSSCADVLVKIPMPGKAESMNASIAGAILIYEVVRQRI